MIKQIAWNAFKNTGDIKIMMELLEAEKNAGIETNENTINLKTNEDSNVVSENIIKNTNEISMNNNLSDRNLIDNRITNDLNSKMKT